MTALERGYQLLKDWRGEDYVHGPGALDRIGEVAARYGKRVLLVSTKTYQKLTDSAIASIKQAGCRLVP